MAEVLVLVHRSCASSYKLYKELLSRGLLGRVRLVPVRGPEYGGRLVWSVPWLLYNGEPAGSDPLDPGVVEAAVEGSRLEPPADPVEAFMEAVLHSSAASSLVALNYSLEPVLSEDLAKAALHTPLTGMDPGEVLARVRAEARGLLGEWSVKIGRALAVGFVRELWWSRGGSLSPEDVESAVEEDYFRLWLLAKASLGRSGLPSDPRFKPNPIVEEAESFLLRVGPILAERVEREQRELIEDEEWRKIVG